MIPLVPRTANSKGIAQMLPPNSFVWTAAACALLFVCAAAQEQNEPEKLSEQLYYRAKFRGPYERLIGTWVGEQLDDVLGKRVTEKHTYRWVLNEQFVEKRVLYTVEGETPVEAIEFIGWDGSKLQERRWRFESAEGAHWQSTDVLCHEGKFWIRKYVGMAGRKSMSWTEEMKLNGDSYTVSIRDHLVAGTLIAPDTSMEFRRQRE
jgi:hypothetical protein